MFRSSTVLVLGAGSSRRAGMPEGRDLKLDVANSLNIQLDDFGRFWPICDQAIRAAIERHMEESKVWPRDPSPYWKAFEIIIRATPYTANVIHYSGHLGERCRPEGSKSLSCLRSRRPLGGASLQEVGEELSA
jgi:hypothetical protein